MTGAFVPERQMTSAQGDCLCPERGQGWTHRAVTAFPPGMTPPMALRAPASTTTKDPSHVPPRPCCGGCGWEGALTQPRFVLNADSELEERWAWHLRPEQRSTRFREARDTQGHTAEGRSPPSQPPRRPDAFSFNSHCSSSEVETILFSFYG